MKTLLKPNLYSIGACTLFSVSVNVMAAESELTPALTQAKPVAQSTAEIERISIHYRQAYRGNVASQELPQAITVLDSSLISDTGVTRFQELLDFSSSIARQNDGGGLWDSFSLRGFPGNENIPSGYLINGFNGGRAFSGHRDLSNVEYVEILKGPGSALYGRSEPGGTINIITKKPQYETSGFLKASAASEDQYRLEGDFTTGLSEDIAFRINGALQDYGSFRDEVFSNKKVVSPSFRWQINDDSSLLYEMEYLKHEQLFDRGIVVIDNNINTVPRSRYLGDPNDGATEIEAQSHQLTYDNQLNQQWSLSAGYGYRYSTLNGFSSDAELAQSRQSLYDDGETLTRQHRYRDYNSVDHAVRFELSGSVMTGNINHNLLVGVDAYDYQLYTGLYRYRGSKGDYAINIFQPVYSNIQPDVSPLYQKQEQQQAWGTYIQDQMDLTDKWKLQLGLRFDAYDQQIDDAVTQIASSQSDQRVSPKIGLVYVYSDELSVYSVYSEGYLPVSGTDYAGSAFAPEESTSVEAGIKFMTQWRQDMPLTGTVAIFDAKKSNILTADPVNVGFSATLGEAKSTGVEVDLDADLTDNLTAKLSYAYLDTRTVNEVINPDWGVMVSAGSRLVNVPKHTASVIIKQDLSVFNIDGNAGINWRYVDSRLGDAVDPEFQLSAYQLVGLFVNSRLDNNINLGLAIENLFDEHYIANSYSALWAVPGEPRSVKVSVSYEF
ncbi:TonB-dependent siderophore receptor [Shewanella sp. MF05960]|uniref:TonB-dependent siderophore receptor n=1 Tax=Shewanella sp. MF05960 TaxID=3434874 RepID=UPI003D7A3152